MRLTMLGIANHITTKPDNKMAGKPTEKIFKLGAARVMKPTPMFTNNNVMTTGKEISNAATTSTVLLEHKVEERTQELRLTLDQLARVNAQLARQSREDGLTGALNRLNFDVLQR